MLVQSSLDVDGDLRYCVSTKGIQTEEKTIHAVGHHSTLLLWWSSQKASKRNLRRAIAMSVNPVLSFHDIEAPYGNQHAEGRCKREAMIKPFRACSDLEGNS